jgi:hypothetical protein
VFESWEMRVKGLGQLRREEGFEEVERRVESSREDVWVWSLGVDMC